MFLCNWKKKSLEFLYIHEKFDNNFFLISYENELITTF